MRALKGSWSPNYPPVDAQQLGSEFADFFVLIAALASQFEVDLEAATRSKFFDADGDREWKSRSPS